ncbi:MAG: MgtC/SapB family protein [Proteobacteria bacterium]|nr:MgtC/SapB family protein [Pseudomonadota bacterium]
MSGVWSQVLSAAAAEFSDVDDVQHVTRVTIRLLLAGALGFALGFEREAKGKSAGARTHMLVAMGSALFVLAPQVGGAQMADMSRVIQGLVAGIGFLCAGAILKTSDEHAVKGLTTAAGMWMTAAIGMACGLGREATAIFSTVLALVVLALVPHFSRGLQGMMGGAKQGPSGAGSKDELRD